jgi:hypothetical protein
MSDVPHRLYRGSAEINEESALAPPLLQDFHHLPHPKGSKGMMNLRAGLLALSLLSVSSVASAAGQPRVAILPMSGVNIHAGYLQAARDIFKDHLMGTARFYVIGVPGNPPDHEFTPDEALALGRTVQADLMLATHIVHLSGTARVRLIAYRADGSIAYTDGVSTAGGPDDLDPTLKRLAIGFATGKPASQTGEIDSVTQKEADPYLKQTATKVFGLRLAAAVPLGRPAGKTTGATGLGLFWLYDAREFMAEVWGDFFTSSGGETARMFDIGIAGYYPFSRRNVTPYAGAGAAWSSASFGGSGASGMRLHGAFGMLVGRLWSVQMRAELGYFFNLFGERAYIGTTGTTTAASFGHGPMLTLGLGF